MKQFTLNPHGLNLVVEVDQGALFWYRVRLIIDNDVADERNLFWGTTRLRANHAQPVTVDVTAGFFGARRVVLRDGTQSVAFTKDR
ncbi:hypothetical protein [Nesterenkonia sp. HG001]|uniref:hypothetical protein n=1 Tax=Nesterenkonia sp. HG001 TaxID=2983207 RepID=UPI002AC67AD9|nr:hypothetical protein [Nesterenkonia sp. HG001]MDZ5076599.1 hypothetical protein [Nesterenkonia sp. HG001]